MSGKISHKTEKTMKIEMTDKWVQRALVAFLGLGACSYGCMFITYILWFMGVWPTA